MPKKRFKGPASRAIDAWYRKGGDVARNLTDAQTLLRSESPFKDIVATLKSEGKGDDEFKYPMDTSTLKGEAFENAARKGYLDSIDRALDHSPPVTITTTWETGAGNPNLRIEVNDRTDDVEVVISVPDVKIEAADEKKHKLTDVTNL